MRHGNKTLTFDCRQISNLGFVALTDDSVTEITLPQETGGSNALQL